MKTFFSMNFTLGKISVSSDLNTRYLVNILIFYNSSELSKLYKIHCQDLCIYINSDHS